MGYPAEIIRIDELRAAGRITHDEYARLLHGQLVSSLTDYMLDVARGIRDRQGRRNDLKHVPVIPIGNSTGDT